MLTTGTDYLLGRYFNVDIYAICAIILTMDHLIDHRPLAAFMYARRLIDESAAIEHVMSTAAKVAESLEDLASGLSRSADGSEEELQSIYYESGKIWFKDDLRWWFNVIYQIMLGQDEGPRLGQFTKIMTAEWVISKLDAAMHDPWGHLTRCTKT